MTNLNKYPASGEIGMSSVLPITTISLYMCQKNDLQFIFTEKGVLNKFD